ncbi:MAG: hypothetical protein GEU86_21170 [Actinophytocola sp.]|nr:hypothetical protein [Actinophytocola sp.]
MILSLIAGITLGGGMLYDLANRGAGLIQRAIAALSNGLVGASVTAVIGVLLCLEMWRVLSRKGGGQPHRIVHPLLAFVAPVLLVAAGGIFAELAGLLDQGATEVSQITRTFFGGGR